jgi:hypothetical protein
MMSREDLNSVLEYLFEFAKIALKKQGEFYPFGARMVPSGEVKAVGADAGREHPPSQELIDILTSAFMAQASAGEIKAAGICMDVRTIPPGQSEKSEAICAVLEHEDGDAINVFLPYKKHLLGRIKYGEVFATQATPSIFVARSDN